MHMRDSKSASPAPLLKTMSTGNVPSDYTTSTTSTLLLPAIEIIDEERYVTFDNHGSQLYRVTFFDHMTFFDHVTFFDHMTFFEHIM